MLSIHIYYTLSELKVLLLSLYVKIQLLNDFFFQNWVEKMMYQKYSKMGWENDIPKIFKNV